MSVCLTCGQQTHTDEHIRLWAIASRWFPLVALDLIECGDCHRYKAGVPASSAWLLRRSLWLESGPCVPKLDERDPATKAAVRRAAKAAKAHRKTLTRERAAKRKKNLRKHLRKWKKDMKRRTDAIREVFERAIEE